MTQIRIIIYIRKKMLHCKKKNLDKKQQVKIGNKN